MNNRCLKIWLSLAFLFPTFGGIFWLVGGVTEAEAADHVLEWSRVVSNVDIGGYLTVDPDGNVYVYGYFEEEADFDPSDSTDIRTSMGSGDAFLSKYDSSGVYQWTRAIGGTGWDDFWAAYADQSGNVYAAGEYRGVVDLDPGVGEDIRTSSGGADVLLTKYDSNGNVQWTRSFGGPGFDGAWVVSADSNGNVYLGGTFAGSVDFDPSSGIDIKTEVGSGDAFLSKYDSLGNYQWTKVVGGTGWDLYQDLSVDSQGNIYASGFFSNTVDFNPGVETDLRTSVGTRGGFFTKFDSSGDYQWTRAFGGNGLSVLQSIDNGGNMYIVGYFVGTIDFDPGIGTDLRIAKGDRDTFLTKYNSLGDYQWTKTIGDTTSSTSYGPKTFVSQNGDIFLADQFSGVRDFDPGLGTDIRTSAGSYDISLSKYDAAGNYLWTRTVGGTSGDWMSAFVGDTNDNLYLVGGFEGIIDVDMGMGVYEQSTGGIPGIFITKYTFDSIPPNVPLISNPINGTITNNNSVNITGTGEISSTINLYRDGASQGTTTADSTGSWSWTASATWSDGSYSITASATDAANNASSLSSSVALNIDTVAPNPSSPTIPIWGDRTDTLKPPLSGIGDAGQTVRIWLNGNLAGTANIDSSGNWIWTSSSDLAIGNHSIEFSVIDSAGNESARSGSRTFQIVDDYDNDGLNTSQEEASGTNPHIADSDGDGMNDGAEVEQSTNPLKSDTDSDESNDSEELAIGTNPLDRGSVLPKREKTLCTEWNGFLGMWNVIEHVNTGTKKINIESMLNDLFGNAQDPVHFGLKRGYQYDLLVHDMTGFETDLYGLICSTATDGQSGDLDGRMVFYKPDAATGGYQFAFAMPLGNGLSGTQYVPYNTYQPSLNPTDVDNLAANWIQLTNLSTTKQTGTLVFYNREGSEGARQSVTLKAGARFDFPAHDLAGLKSVGIVEWIPNSITAKFQLRNLRYYYRADGVSIPLGDDFDSALQLEGVVGNGQLLTVPLDTENSSAVLELANTLNEEARVEVNIYAAYGGSALHHQTYKLKPHATYHLVADTILNGRQGIATIKGNKLASVIATAMQYGRNEALGINTVYGIQASEPLGTVMRSSYNTFLNQGCRLLMANPTSAAVTATVAMKRYDGTNVELGRMLAVPAHGLTNYNLCTEDEPNVYGVVTVQPQTANTIFSTVLRIGENEQYRFATPVRE